MNGKKYRLGRKQKRAILDENGIEVAVLRKGQEKVAYELCQLLNQEDYELGTAGDVAKKYNTPVGSIGCPNCGVTSHGTLREICGWCDKPYFE